MAPVALPLGGAMAPVASPLAASLQPTNNEDLHELKFCVKKY